MEGLVRGQEMIDGAGASHRITTSVSRNPLGTVEKRQSRLHSMWCAYQRNRLRIYWLCRSDALAEGKWE